MNNQLRFNKYIKRIIRGIFVIPLTGLGLLAASSISMAATYIGNPSNYLSQLSKLTPGDTLSLEAGTYTDGLPVYNLNGDPGNPIIISGPAVAPRAVFTGSNSQNTVRIRESGHVGLYNLELNGMGRAGDGVKAESRWAHHITIDNFLIYGFDADQSIVGISTNGCPTWGWVIRNNVINGAGTGMYLGNSDGSMPFINGLIEYNLIIDTAGYNIQIKHQNPRPTLTGMPTSDTKTVIRHNVFSKANNASSGGNARPNLLVDIGRCQVSVLTMFMKYMETSFIRIQVRGYFRGKVISPCMTIYS